MLKPSFEESTRDATFVLKLIKCFVLVDRDHGLWIEIEWDRILDQ